MLRCQSGYKTIIRSLYFHYRKRLASPEDLEYYNVQMEMVDDLVASYLTVERIVGEQVKHCMYAAYLPSPEVLCNSGAVLDPKFWTNHI